MTQPLVPFWFRQPTDRFADPLPSYVRGWVLFRDGFHCVDCVADVPADPLDLMALDAHELEIHHKVARQEGGDNHPINLVTVCKAHHLRLTRLALALRYAMAATPQPPAPDNLCADELTHQLAIQAARRALGRYDLR